MNTRFDPEIKSLIPHREPMLLINQLLQVSKNMAQARVMVDEDTPFVEIDRGVPAWIGLEYMGQTAALIAGHQQRLGTTEPHLGFLMGSRSYETSVSYFRFGEPLIVKCEEVALVGASLATFNCTISEESKANSEESQTTPIASALLSVFRRPLTEHDTSEN